MAFQPCQNKKCNDNKRGELGNCARLYPSDFTKCHNFKSEAKESIQEADIFRERIKVNGKPKKKRKNKPTQEIKQ